MDKSNIEFLDNGNVKIFGQEYTESFFRFIAVDIPEDAHIYLTDEDGVKTFVQVDKKNVKIND